MIAVTFALPAERPAKLKNRPDVEVVLTGVGGKVARARIEQLFARTIPELLICCGFAGAVTDELQVGDLLLAENFCTAATQHLHIRRGKLATAQRVIDSPDERAEFARQHGAIAVDMETQFVADVCAAAGVPLLALRAISDTPAAPLPLPPHILFDVELQRTSYARLLLHLSGHPAAVPRLARFAKQVAIARHSLGEGIELLLRGLDVHEHVGDSRVG
jgi:adenosylhomocysteine nucleosidase